MMNMMSYFIDKGINNQSIKFSVFVHNIIALQMVWLSFSYLDIKVFYKGSIFAESPLPEVKDTSNIICLFIVLIKLIRTWPRIYL